MNRLAETRNIPPHNPQATTAAEAYQISEIITTADKRHLLHDRFAEALKSPANLQALEDDKIWGGLDPFVRYMLRTKQDEGLLPTRQKDCSQWLALYHVCQKLMKLRVGVVLEETVTPLEGSAGEGVQVSPPLESIGGLNRAHRLFCLAEALCSLKLLPFSAVRCKACTPNLEHACVPLAGSSTTNSWVDLFSVQRRVMKRRRIPLLSRNV